MKFIPTDFLYQPIVKKHIAIIAVGFLLGILLYGYIHSSGFQNISELLLSGLLGIIVSYITYYSNGLLNGWFPWKEQPGVRLLCGITLQGGLGILTVFGCLWIYTSLSGKPSLFLNDPQDVLIKIMLLLFSIALIYNIIYFATYAYYQYAKGQLMQIQLQRKQTQLQLGALKNQLSPHFLFNSINTLSSLFQKDVKKAEIFIRSLAKSYQYTLQTYEDPLVSLKEELDFVASYCYLIKTRFGDHLKMKIDLPEALLSSKVPPLTIQMLVENAVKHNIMDASRVLELGISSEAGKLLVVNNKTGKRPGIDSFKIGLNNITARYKLLTNQDVVIENTDEFKVLLPIIR
ncbi:MAG: sensor histidine kinase [Flavobacteriaceae bacterium]